jgi:hypothetical protein
MRFPNPKSRSRSRQRRRCRERGRGRLMFNANDSKRKGNYVPGIHMSLEKDLV